MYSNEQNIVTDKVGNELHVGDRVAINTAKCQWKTGTVTKLYNTVDYADANAWTRERQVQVVYDPIFLYGNVYSYHMTKDNIKFRRKIIRNTIDTANVIKLLPEYLEDDKDETTVISES